MPGRPDHLLDFVCVHAISQEPLVREQLAGSFLCWSCCQQSCLFHRCLRKGDARERGKIERDILERCPREMSERKEEDKGPGTKEKGFNSQEGSRRLSGWLWISLSLQRAGWSGKQEREGTQSLTDLLLSPLNLQSAGALCSGKGSGENRMPQATHK